MKECDNSQIHISSIYLLSVCLLIILDTFITMTITTLQHFATLHHTSPNYTSLHLSTLHFTLFHFIQNAMYYMTLSFLCWNSISFIKYVLKFKYQPGHFGVKFTIPNTPGEYQQMFLPHFDRGESVRMDLCQFVMHSEFVGHHRALNCRLWEV